MSNEYEDQNEDLSEARADINAENNARQLNMRAIIARQREVLAQNDPSEGLDGLDDGVPDDDVAGGISPAFMPSDDSIKRALEKMPRATDNTNKHKVKILGEERELTTEELIAMASKTAAADKYLADAAEAKRNAEAMLATAKSIPTSKPEMESQPDIQMTDEDLELARAMQVGSEEDAAKAIARLRGKQASPSINMDEIAARVIDVTQFKQDAQWFQETYKDIFQDDKLKTLALGMDDQLRAAGDKRPYRERYQAIGDELRKWTGKNPDNEAKSRKKQETLTNIPTASVKSRTVVEDEDEENIPDVIANMAKQRGQLRI